LKEQSYEKFIIFENQMQYMMHKKGV